MVTLLAGKCHSTTDLLFDCKDSAAMLKLNNNRLNSLVVFNPSRQEVSHTVILLLLVRILWNDATQNCLFYLGT